MTDIVKINNGPLLADNKIGVVHFGPDYRPSVKDRPFTVAYRGTGDMVEVAVAIVHPKDKFVRKIGTRTAAEKFLAGETIKVPVPRHFQRRYAFFVSTLFSI